MRLKEETRIALFSIAAVYILFNVVKVLFFPEQTVLWHIVTSLVGLAILFVFGYIVKGIDLYLDRIFPFERNPFKRLLLQFGITLAAVLILRAVGAIIAIDVMHIQVSRELWVVGFALNIFMVMTVILSIFGYHFFIRWKEEKVNAVELEKEKAQVQYDNLKNQLNPHFLFNSLSSLNSLIFENPQLASDFLQQLSKVYRYVLENKEKNLVSLDTEVDFVNHYAQLLKTRFDGGVEVEYHIDERVKEMKIVPVTLQVLYENAVKHNITTKSSPLLIEVYNEDDMLVVKNKLQLKHQIETSNRQGLENLKNLYAYMTGKQVEVDKTEKSFAIKIPLVP